MLSKDEQSKWSKLRRNLSAETFHSRPASKCGIICTSFRDFRARSHGDLAEASVNGQDLQCGERVLMALQSPHLSLPRVCSWDLLVCLRWDCACRCYCDVPALLLFGCQRLTLPNIMLFFVRSAAYHSLCCSQETTHWSVSSSQVLLRPVVVERALAGAGVAVLSSRLVELVEPWTKLGRDKNWVLRQGVSINGGTPKWMVCKSR